jgi:hypothetical protein
MWSSQSSYRILAASIGLALVGLQAPPAFAAKASAELGDSIDVTRAGAGTWSGFAYAMRIMLNGAAAPAPANQTSSWFTQPGAATLASPVPPAVSPTGAPIFLSFGGGLFTGAERSYGQAVSAGRAKALIAPPLDSETVSSRSGGADTSIRASASYSLIASLFGNPAVRAYAYSDSDMVEGRAAAIAYDPYTLPADQYDLGDGSVLVSVDMQMDHANQIGDDQFNAFDSRYAGSGLTGGNIIYGAPLWSLLVTSNGVALSNKSNVVVRFALNPAAVADGAFSYLGEPLSLGDYMTFDSALADNLWTQLSVVGGEITLNAYDPFPSDFVYNVTF